MGTQKNRLNETVLLSIHTFAKNYGQENIYNFTQKIFLYLKPVARIYVVMRGIHIVTLIFLSKKRFCGTHWKHLERDVSNEFHRICFL